MLFSRGKIVVCAGKAKKENVVKIIIFFLLSLLPVISFAFNRKAAKALKVYAKIQIRGGGRILYGTDRDARRKFELNP